MTKTKPNTDLRKQIEGILRDKNLEITWGEVVDGDVNKLVDQLLSLFEERVLEVIGEDERIIKAGMYAERFRNELRVELRKKLEEDR